MAHARLAYQPTVVHSPNLSAPVTLFDSTQLPVSRIAVKQARRAASLPGVVKAIGMPDIHPGSALPNGFVLATEGVVHPGAVGRDINCGMRLMKTGLFRNEIDVRQIVDQLAHAVHLGHRKGTIPLTEEDIDAVLTRGVAALPSLSDETRSRHPVWDIVDGKYVEGEINYIEQGGSLQGNPGAVARSHKRIGMGQVGTLGEGNHFVELQVVDRVLNPEVAAAFGLEQGAIVLMIHVGSRGLGHDVGTQYMQIAESLARGAGSPVRGIYPLRTDHAKGQEYLGAMNAAANFAYANRLVLGALAAKVVTGLYPQAGFRLVYDVCHNMARLEGHDGVELLVHRKGATRAFPPSRMGGTPFELVGQPVLIPGSMGTHSYVLAGVEGNERSLYSANHGAGRLLSRSEALGFELHEGRTGERWREQAVAAISDREFRKSMRGIETVFFDRRTIKAEAPQAYKDIEQVMDVVFAAGLATGVARLRPLGVIKH